jgi:acetyl esterase/lipase
VISRRAALGLLAGGALGGVLAACSKGSGDSSPSTTTTTVPRFPARYGAERAQAAELWLPAPRPAKPIGVVVLVHGGFWRSGYGRDLMEPLARDVIRRGWAAWNVDYRPSSASGGGWPGTFTDVADAIDLLATKAEERSLDLDKVVVVGHSAGGCLALWAAARAGLPAIVPGAKPKVEPALVVSLAGVNNLIAGSFEKLGDGAVDDLMGGPPTDAGDAYTYASPAERLPIGVPQVLVHGLDDVIVPVEQTTFYGAKATKAGDDVTVITVAGETHFDVIDPKQSSWRKTVEHLEDVLEA